MNLTTGKVSSEPLDPTLAREYIGARGLGDQSPVRRGGPKVDRALARANKLIFAPGPLTGTFAPSGGRYNVVTKGPLTDTIAASNSGGDFGPELKYAGYDMVIFEGKADAARSTSGSRTTWSRSATRPASGARPSPTPTDLVRAETDEEAKVACIGPAGEHQVLFANIMNDMHRAAGRSGVGAVMGSKNLKADRRGRHRRRQRGRPRGLLTAAVKARQMILDAPGRRHGPPAYGTRCSSTS